MLENSRRHAILRTGMIGFLAAGFFFSYQNPVSAETLQGTPDVDAGEISIHFTHYQAQELTFYLEQNSDALDFTDAVLTFQDSTMNAPLTMSYLSDDGSYLLYDNDVPVEELSGTFSISMVTKPGYELNMDEIAFNVNGQTIPNGGSVVLTESSVSMSSTISCSAVPETPAVLPDTPAEEPAAPSENIPEEPSITKPDETPAADQTPEAGNLPEQETAEILPSATVNETPSTPDADVSEPAVSETADSAPLASVAIEPDRDLSTIPSPTKKQNNASTSHQVVPSAATKEAALSVKANTQTTISSPSAATVETSELVKTETSTHARSWLHDKTNQALALMIGIILILILIELFLTLRENFNKKHYHRFY